MAEGSANPLVAARKDSTTGYTGIGLVEGIVDCANGFSSGSWIDASIGGLSTGLEALGLITDPLGTVVSWGVAWLMEHLKPLSDALDWLAGDPDQITAYAQTWRNIAERANGQAAALAEAVGKDIAHWSGTAGAAYRTYAGELHQSLLASAKGASTIAMIVEGAGLLVALVRELVRDLIADFVSVLAVRLWEWLAEEAVTLGIGTPWVVSQVSALVGKWAAKIARLLNGLTSSVRKLKPILSKLDELIDALKATLRKLRGAPHAPGTHPNVHDVSYHPHGGPDGPSLHGGSDGPSLAGGHSPDGTGVHGPDGSGSPHGPDKPGGPDGPTLSGSKHPDGTGGSASRTPGGKGDGASLAGSAGGRSDPTPRGDLTCVSDPVDVATGAVILTETDVSLPGLLPLALSRTHVSSYRAGRCFGRSWASTLDQRVEVDADGVWLATEDGMLLRFPLPPTDGAVVFAQRGPRWQLRSVETGYLVCDPQRGLSWHYTPATAGVAVITAISDRNGHRIDIGRDPAGVVTEVRHSGGYRVLVDVAGGHVCGLRLSDGASAQELVGFGYDAAGNLAEVRRPGGAVRRYRYDDDHRMVGWRDANGVSYRYRYDTAGRCVGTIGPGGAMSGQLDYAPDGSSTRVVDALGQTTIYHLDAHGQVTAVTDPLGASVARTYDQVGQLTSVTDQLGRTTSYRHDQLGNVVAVRRPDGVSSVVGFDQQCRPVMVADADGAVWQRRFDAAGNLTAVTDPAGATISYRYDQRGGLAAVVDAAGNTTTVTCDPAGLVVAVVDPTGATTRFDRDHAGRVVAVTDPLGAVTRLAYTPDGKLAGRTGPDGAHESWAYDGEGNLVAYTDPAGALTRSEYTHFDLLAARTGPDGTRLVFGYDAELRLTSVTNPQGLSWTYTYDPAGRLVSETDFNGRTVRYQFDPAGQLIARTNGDGPSVVLQRDLLGNVTVKQTPAGPTHFAYDAAGRLIRATSPDADLAITRDALGRVVAETVNGRTLTVGYDAAGHRVSRRTPGGVASDWTFDARHLPATLRTGAHTTTFAHDPAGRPVGRTVSTATAWLQVTSSFDPADRLLSQIVTAGGRPAAQAGPLIQRSYTYRPDGALTAIDDTAGRRTFSLDPAGRVTAVAAAGWSERYAYDSAGNLTATTASPDAGDAGGYLQYTGTLVRRAGRTRFEYDAQGRLTLRQRTHHSAKPDTWRYTWNTDDQLTAVHAPDGTWWTYRYDPLGRRIAKTRLAPDGTILETTDFTWDGVHLAEQAHLPGGGRPWQVTTFDYHPGSFTPILQTTQQVPTTPAQVNDNRRYFAIVTDLVGTPTELLTPDGRVAWHTQSTIWGTTTAVATAGVQCPLRLPGQYHDAETGHHYNLFRYYHPDTGRYLTPDPIGLDGGPNPHQYVPNPTGWIDPLGLAGCLRPGGHVTEDVAPHANLSPGVNRAPGHANTAADGRIQSHHIIQNEWAVRNNIPGYRRNDAPAVLLPSTSGDAHAQISAAQRAWRAANGYSTTIQQEFRASYQQLTSAGVPQDVVRKAIKDAYKYFHSLGAI